MEYQDDPHGISNNRGNSPDRVSDLEQVNSLVWIVSILVIRTTQFPSYPCCKSRVAYV